MRTGFTRGAVLTAAVVVAGSVPTYAAASPSSTSVTLGGLPTGVDVDPITGRIFAATLFPSRLVMLDGATNTILTSTPLVGNAWAVAVDPTTHRVYAGADGVAIIDGRTGQPIINRTTGQPLTVTVPGGTFAVAVNARTHRVYAAASGVTAIDGLTNRDTVLTSAPVVVNAGGIATDPLTNRVYVSASSDNTLSVLNGATLKVDAVLPTGASPHAVAVDPLRHRTYVANIGSGSTPPSITVVDTRTLRVSATWASPGGVEGLAIDLLGGRIYVNQPSRGVVALLDPNGTELTTWPVGGYPYRVAANLATGRAYVTNFSGDLNILEPLLPRLLHD